MRVCHTLDREATNAGGVHNLIQDGRSRKGESMRSEGECALSLLIGCAVMLSWGEMRGEGRGGEACTVVTVAVEYTLKRRVRALRRDMKPSFVLKHSEGEGGGALHRFCVEGMVLSLSDEFW